MRIIKGIAFEPEVLQALEEIRGAKQHFRSEFINEVLKEKLGLNKPEQEVKK